MECTCEKCGMSVKDFKCGKCDSDLVKDTITKDDGSKIQVAKCPQGHGKIKSPTCCNHDMVCS